MKVLSWNVECLNQIKGKITDKFEKNTSILKFIAYVIALTKSDVIGLMEITRNHGKDVKPKLISFLNNMPDDGGARVTWDGRFSTQQDSRNKPEQYIYLWNSKVQLDMLGKPGPVALLNVADAQAFEKFFLDTNITGAQPDKFFEALAYNEYIRKPIVNYKSIKSYRVNQDKWELLKREDVKFSTAPSAPKPPGNDTTTAANCKRITQILKDLDILRFLNYNDRSPYILNLIVDNKPLTVVLYHAPAPDPNSVNLSSGINVIAMNEPLRPAPNDKNLLVMGDFNVGSDKMGVIADKWDRVRIDDSEAEFKRVSPAGAKVFLPFATDLKTESRMEDVTCLTSKFLLNGSDVAKAKAKTSTYDKFFFHKTSSPGKILIDKKGVIETPLELFYPGSSLYNEDLTKLLVFCFHAFRGEKYYLESIKRKNKRLEDNKLKKNTDDLKRTRSDANLDEANAKKQKTGAQTNSLEKRAAKDGAKVLADGQNIAEDDDAINSLRATQLVINNPEKVRPAGIGDALNIYRSTISIHLAIGIELQS